MSLWTNHPFLRITIVFALGILSARLDASPPVDSLFWLSIAIFIFAIGIKLLFKKISNSYIGNLILSAVFFVGAYHYESTDTSSQKNALNNSWENCQASIGIINSFPIEKEKYVVYEVLLSMGIRDTVIFENSTTLLLYEKKDSVTRPRNYGDKIRIEGHPFLIGGAKNPYEFDFSHYMADRHIYFQQFVTPEQITHLSSHQANDLMAAILRVRSHFEEIIKSQINNKDEQAIVLALLLGIKGQLDTEVKAAYAAAGAMHVLAVSGLHVSIIYFILNWLFRGIPPGSFKRFACPAISIIALWIYALLTGFSPSIIRAVTMFSIIIFAKILDRKTQVYNSLAFAAFVLLLFDPMFLFNVGFQLSFLAVTGIVYIYPQLYALWKIHNRVGDFFWKLVCVSLAAQIATFPLSIYYFHQFPSYFLVANMVVIPAAFVIMILGLTMLAFGSLSGWIGWLLEYLVGLINTFVGFFTKLDGSVIDWIYISGFQTTLIYAAIILFFALFKYRRFSYAWMIILIISIFSIDKTIELNQRHAKEELVFYSLSKGQLIDQTVQFQATLFALDSTLKLEDHVRHVEPYRLRNALLKPKDVKIMTAELKDFAKLSVLNERRTLFINHNFDINQIQFRLKSDIVVLSNHSVDSLSILDQVVDFNTVIMDNTNSPQYIERLKKEAINLNLSLVSLKDKAYVISSSRNQKFLDMLF